MIIWIPVEEKLPIAERKISRNMRLDQNTKTYMSEVVLVLGKWKFHEESKWVSYFNCARLYRDYNYSNKEYFWLDSEGSDLNIDWNTVITHWAELPSIPIELLAECSVYSNEGLEIFEKSKNYQEMIENYNKYLNNDIDK